MTTRHALIVPLGLALMGACHPREAPAPSPPAAGASRPLAISAITIDLSIVALCDLDAFSVLEQRPGETPPATAEALRSIARCTSDGALAGRRLEAVAYGGPGHEDLYREQFGESRAETLRRILVDDGAPPEAIDARETTAAQDAPAGDLEWPKDRVVELRVLTENTW